LAGDESNPIMLRAGIDYDAKEFIEALCGYCGNSRL
jgi:hypothetical protein